MNATHDPGGIAAELDPLPRASCHALLCGTLAAGATPAEAAQSAAALFPRLDEHQLQSWARYEKARLEDSNLSFRLAVAGDDAALQERVGTLAAWAREFLSALGQAGERLNALGDEARETLMELDAIGRGAATGEDDGESEELMYAELVEHVRLSALFLYRALNPPQPSVAQ